MFERAGAGLCLAGMALVCLGAAAAFAAAPTTAQRAKIREAAEAVERAEILIKAKKKIPATSKAIEECGALLKEADVENSPDVAKLAGPVLRRLKKAHAEAIGLGLSVGEPPTPAQPEKRANAKSPKKGGATTISFGKQIAPLLVAKCGGCHIAKASGGVSMATYTALMQGSADAGIIVSRQRDGRGSRIVEVIESGDMPRGGGRVSPEELELLVKWIDEGASFDGKDRDAPLGASGNAAPAGGAAATVVKATASDVVQFGRDLGPVLLENCSGCHDSANPPANFSMANFTRFMQGGRNGSPIAAGEPEMSLIVKKLRGRADGARMPLNRDPLPEETIAKFEEWVRLGGKFDGGDPAQSLGELVAMIASRLATHEQLAERRASLAAKNWRIILPDMQPQIRETNDFLLYGAVSPERLREVADEAERQVEKLRKTFGVPANDRFIKGRMTLFVFDKSFEYAEVGERLENRPIPPTWKGHFRYTVSDAYGCILPPKRDEYSLSAIVAQQLAGAHVASLGAPTWLAEGSARVIAARTAAKESRVRKWEEHLPAALANIKSVDAFFTGATAPDDAEAIGYGFAKSLMKSQPRFQLALNQLRSGANFDAAFQRAFGGVPNETFVNWAGKSGTSRGAK